MQRKILVGTIDGLHELGDNGRVQMAGHEIKSLALGDSGWWAVLDEGEVWRSADGGDWGEVTALEGLRANCVLPATGGPFVGSSEAHLFALRGEALERVESFEQTRERDTWHTPWGGPPDVRSMVGRPFGRGVRQRPRGRDRPVCRRRSLLAADHRHSVGRAPGAVRPGLRHGARRHGLGPLGQR